MAVSTVRADGRRALSPVDAARSDVSVIGGKAAGLARLETLGVRVPAWVVIPAPVMRVEMEPSAGDSMLLEIIAEAAARVGGDEFAVRSSAVIEDGEQHSFAGQFDTLLHVRRAALADAVRACWASARSDRALGYLARTRTANHAIDLAVIIQRMIEGEASGVLVTADPVSGDTSRVRISACRGVGDRLVSGAIDADELVTDRTGAILESNVCGDAPAIDAATIRSLVRASVVIADAVGAPRDIEWTVENGEIWFLQARPVTSRVTPQPRRIVWDNSNIQESYCGVTTPLTFSFARAAYAAVYAQTMRAVGIRERVIDEHRDVLHGLLGLIHGRVYYNLNNWYRGLLLLPAFRRNKADMERMMGVEEPVAFVQDETSTWIERLGRAPRMLRAALGLARRFATLERDTTSFLARFDALMTRIDRAAIDGRPLGELAELLRLLRREGIERWTTPIVNDFRVMMTVGRLRRLVARVAFDDTDRVMQTLIGGADVAVSSAPAMSMRRMADAARRAPAARAALMDGEPDALARAAQASPELDALLAELLDTYGDRCMGELKLESRSLRDDPSFVTAMVVNYLRADRRGAEVLAREANDRRTKVETDVARHLGPIDHVRLRRALHAARASIAARETMRLARARLFGAHRQIYRAIGARLQERGRLDDRLDVFYLTVDEVAAASDGDSHLDLAAAARARRATFAGFAELPAPNRVITATVPDPFAPAIAIGHASSVRDARDLQFSVSDARVLHGLGCSAGIAEGPVRIITGPDDDLTIAGHVLVAPRTDPGWAPLFHAAAGIIVERGSVLSHSAVLARELGLPAVVGIPGIVAVLRDGERVRIDGGAGTVERLGTP
jgi:phosphohistidine swiveling domain-containing protein